MPATQPKAVMSDPLTGFYDPSKIGSYGDVAASHIQPDVKPIANVAAGYTGTPTATPASVPSMSDIGLNDPFSGNQGSGDFYGPGQPVADQASNPDPLASGLDPTAGPGGLSPGATATAAGPAAVGGSNFWDDFINGITGGQGIGSSLGSMAPYLADFALAQKYASKQQSETNKTIQPLFTQAQQYLDAATKDLKLYESGTVNPAQQKMIDQYSVSQKAQVAQQLQSAGITDSGALNSAYQQIDDNAMVMKQNFVQQSLSNALNLEQAGMQPLLIAIQDKLLSDTDISKTMMELTGTLAQAWAYQQGQAARGGGGGSATAGGAAGGAGSSLVKQGENWVKGKVNDWLGGSSSGAGGFGSAAEIGGASADTIGAGSLVPEGFSNNIGTMMYDAGTNMADIFGGGAAAAEGAAGAGVLADVAGVSGADIAGLYGGMGITEASLGAEGAAAAGGASSAMSGLAVAAPYAAAAVAAAIAVDKIGNHYNWFGGNDPSKITGYNLPSGAMNWKAPNGDNIVASPISKSGAQLAMQVNQGKSPGDPVLYPKGGNAKTGVGGWVLSGFRRGDDKTLKNQATGQTIQVGDAEFQKIFGMDAGQFDAMYQMITSSYKQ